MTTTALKIPHHRYPTTNALITWDFRGQGKPARCLLRYSAAVPNTAILSGLPNLDSHYRPLMQDMQGAMNAAWQKQLCALGFDSTSMRWIVHTGLFSTYDRLWTAEHDYFSECQGRFQNEQFIYGDKKVEFEKSIETKNVLFVLDDVEKLVKKLETVC